MNKIISVAVLGLAISSNASASACFQPDEEGAGHWCAFVPIIEAPETDPVLHLSELLLNAETDRYEVVSNLSSDLYQERSIWSDQMGEYVPYGMALKAAYDAGAESPLWENAPGLVARYRFEPCPQIAARSEGFQMAILDHYYFDH